MIKYDARGRPKPPRRRRQSKAEKARAKLLSKRLKELWADPEWRAKRQKDLDALAEGHRAGKYPNRAGVPTGFTRETVKPLWDRAHALADRFIAIMKEKGELPEVVVPDTDAAKAEAAMHEVFKLAVCPATEAKVKIQALNTVLNFTKSKPESKSKLTLNKAEDFLDAIASGGDDA